MRSAPPRPKGPSRPRAGAPSASAPLDEAWLKVLWATSGEEPDWPPPPPTVVGEAATFALRDTRCFGLRGNNCPARGPFYRAARAIVDGGDPLPILDAYWQVAPKSAAGVLGLRTDHELGDYPPLAAVLPWSTLSPDATLAEMEAATRGYQMQNDQAGWGITDGHTQYGPVSRRKLRAEVERLRALVVSVRDNPAGDGHPPVLGRALVDDCDNRGAVVIDVRDGLHRCAVFGAMDLTLILVRTLDPPVLRSEAQHWHHVRTGLFTEAEALWVFDNYVEGIL